jgi:Cu(I)/Ag(I) efflux system membrane fusion protein
MSASNAHQTEHEPESLGPPMSRWRKFRLLVKVVELRLRFIALMALTGLTFAYWDTIWNRIDKWRNHDHGKLPITVAHVEFFCPMHPSVVRDEQGSCPICGMPLSRRAKGHSAGQTGGVVRVQLAPFRIRQAGIETLEAGFAPLVETMTTVGSVDYDERRLAQVVSKIPSKSRVEKLQVNYNGATVQKGQPLAEIYSPELNSALQELLLAQKYARERVAPKTAVGRSGLGDPNELVRLSTEKLERWGVTRAQIDEILKRGKAEATLPILAPISGHVIKLNVREGQEVMESQLMFEIADLSRVWVKAQIYADDVNLVHVGQAAEATVEGFAGRTFHGTLAFKQLHLDPATRTTEVRFDLDNPDLALSPGLFATVTLRTPVIEIPMFRDRFAAANSARGSARLASVSADEQRICPVTNARLGSMGEPVPIDVDGQKIWTCCDGCPPKIRANPKIYLARLAPPPRDEVLSVPESAVIDTGQTKLVYVEAEPGVFEKRQVVLGPRSGDRYAVLEGLLPGERIASTGAFLIDAESRLSGDHSVPTSTSTSPSEPPSASAERNSGRVH